MVCWSVAVKRKMYSSVLWYWYQVLLPVPVLQREGGRRKKKRPKAKAAGGESQILQRTIAFERSFLFHTLPTNQPRQRNLFINCSLVDTLEILFYSKSCLYFLQCRVFLVDRLLVSSYFLFVCYLVPCLSE
jgi:hypothetical protein